MTGRERGERLQIMLSGEELAALDDFRFRNRMPSRASAIREILRRGLGVNGTSAKAGSKSSDFGVLTGRPTSKRTPPSGDQGSGLRRPTITPVIPEAEVYAPRLSGTSQVHQQQVPARDDFALCAAIIAAGRRVAGLLARALAEQHGLRVLVGRQVVVGAQLLAHLDRL